MMIEPEQIQYFILNPFYQRKFLFFIQVSTLKISKDIIIMEDPACIKILFLLNPDSGKKNKIDWESEIRDYFKGLPHVAEIYILQDKDDTGSIKYWIEKLDVTRVVAVGGDGTVTLLAKVLYGMDIKMGIIPAGSANGMAKELGIPLVPKEALDIIVNGLSKPCDLIKINDDEISIHLSDFGLNARLIKYFDESLLRGMWGYGRMVFKVLWNKTLMNAHIIADGVDITTKAYMIVIANATKYGTGALINPVGDMEDGLFEIIIFRKFPVWQLFKMLISYKKFNPESVEIFKTKTATITTRKKTHFQVDGEYKGKIDKVVAEILPSRLNILAPNT
jgi:diacylglycerol kinase (ATP)